MTWLIRPVAIGDIHKTVVKLERRVIPAAALLIGTLAKYHKKLEEWNYHLAHCNDQLSSELQKRNLELRVESILSLNPEKFRHISRFHAFLEEKNNELYLTDLGSKNGTYIEGKKIEKAKLQDEQVFQLGGKKEDSARFKVYKPIEQIYALLVGVDYNRTSDETIDYAISSLDSLLAKTTTPCTRKIITHEQATNQEICSQLKKAETLPENSLFLFWYSAHGEEVYMTTFEDVLLKFQIEEYLNKIKAKKICIIESCYAAGGWDEINLENSLYFFSSREDETSRWGLFTQALIYELERQGIPADPKGIDMSELDKVLLVPQTPARKGEKSIFIC